MTSSSDADRPAELSDAQLDQLLEAANGELLGRVKAAADPSKPLIAIMASADPEAGPELAGPAGQGHRLERAVSLSGTAPTRDQGAATARLVVREDFLRQLLEIRYDPQVEGLARRRAGSPDLAEEALQEAYYAVFKLKDPEKISNLRAYFCNVLTRKAAELRGQLATHPADDVVALAETRHDMTVRQQPAPPVDEAVSRRILATTWLNRFTVQRASLVHNVPGRSPDPVRYRNLIVTVAEGMLRSMVSGDISDADSNRALSAAYPEWFAAGGCAPENGYQRFRRARTDVAGVLRLVVRRIEETSF